MDFNINLVISSIKTHILEKESDVFEPFLVPPRSFFSADHNSLQQILHYCDVKLHLHSFILSTVTYNCRVEINCILMFAISIYLDIFVQLGITASCSLSHVVFS